jgi:hypothetical protein
MDLNFQSHLAKLNSGHSIQLWQNALLAIFDASTGSNFSDDQAETDLTAESRQEAASSHKFVEEYARKNNIDLSKPWQAMKSGLSSTAMAHAWLAANGITEVPAVHKHAFDMWLRAFDANILNSFFESRFYGNLDDVTKTMMQRQLEGGVVRRNLSGGLALADHSARIQSIVGGAQSELLVGNFMIDTQEVAESIGITSKRLSESGGTTSVRINNPFSMAGRLSERVMGFLGATVTKPSRRDLGGTSFGTTDHFKMFGSDLTNLNDGQFMIGSVNVTQAALGKTGRTGSNIESSYYLTKEYADRVGMREEVFKRLMRQGRKALEWAQTDVEENTNLLSFDVDGFSVDRSSVLTGTGLAQAHKDLTSKMTKGNKISIVTYNIGEQYLNKLADAIAKGVSVELTIGSKYDFNQMNAVRLGPDAQMLSLLHKFQQKLESMGKGDLFRLNVDHQNLIHAKISMFETDSGVTSIIGSMNLDDQQFNAYYDGSKGYQGSIRNAGVLLTSNEDAGVLDQRRLMNRIAFASGLYKPFGAGLKPVYDQGFEAIQARVSSLRDKYGLKAWEMRTEQFSQGTIVKASVGGVFNIGNETINLGNIQTLSLFQSDSDLDSVTGKLRSGPRIYVPELSKTITSTYGFQTFLEGQDSNGLMGASLFEADEVIAAGIRTTNSMIQRELQRMVKKHGSVEAVRELLNNPYRKGLLKYQARSAFKDMYKNFPGYEPGFAAFSAKEYARLLMPMTHDGLLDLQLGERAFLDASAINKIMSGEAYRSEYNRELGVRERIMANLSSIGDIGFSSGQASRFKRSGDYNPARVYDLAVFETMRMLARKETASGQYEYMFMLPVSKISQLPQRLQTNMAARNLRSISFLHRQADGSWASSQSIAHKSLLLNQDGSALEGIKMRGIMAIGLTGDNAYLKSSEFNNRYFANDNVTLSAKVGLSTVTRESIGSVMMESLEHLFQNKEYGAFEMNGRGQRTGKALITAAGLAALNHQIAIAEHVDGNSRVTQYMDLRTDGRNSSGMILDFGEGMRAERNSTFVRLNIRAQRVERLQSGSRGVLSMKAPYVMANDDSMLFGSIESLIEGSDIHNAVTSTLFEKNGMMAVFGHGVIKEGSAFLETGIESLRTGAYLQQYEHLKAKGYNMNELFSDKENGQFATLFKKLRPLMSDVEIKAVESMTSENLLSEMKKLSTRFKAGRGISLGSNPFESAVAMAAFGLHASFYADESGYQHKPSDWFNILLGNKNNSMLSEMSTAQILGILPLTFTTAPSASATAMSGRARVNFLNYHAGGYTDAIFGLLGTSRMNQQKRSAYRELLGSSIIGTRGTQEHVFGMTDYNPLSYYQFGMQQEFTDLTRVVRTLQAIAAREKPGPKDAQRVAKLKAQQDLILARIQANLDSGNVRSEFQGSMTSQSINEAMNVARAAGVRTQTLYIPVVENLSTGKVGTENRKNMVAAVMLSPDALQGFGSFSDYSHEIQRLQFQITRNMRVLDKVKYNEKTGKFSANFSEADEELYTRLLTDVASLEQEQRKATVTDLQKSFGGMVGATGQNMIASTLPDLKEGWMLLGDDAYSKMMSAAKSEIMTGIHQAKVGETLVDSTRMLMNALHNEVGINTDTGRLITKLFNDFESSYSNLGSTINILDNIKDLPQELKDKISAQKKLNKQETNALLGSFVEGLLSDTNIRTSLTSGLFQRAGAPMGPVGLQAYKIGRLSDYKGIVNIDGSMSNQVVFLSGAGMQFNLGDYDGDTSSVGFLDQYTRLRTLEILGATSITTAERAKLKSAKFVVNRSFKESAIHFARMYTGMGTMFSEGSLYTGSMVEAASKGLTLKSRVDAGVVEHAQYLQGLEQRIISDVVRGDTKLGKLGVESLGYEELLSKHEALPASSVGHSERELFRIYAGRRDSMYNAAIATNQYVRDIYETSFDIVSRVDALAREQGISSAAAYKQFYAGKYSTDLATKYRDKAFKTFSEMGGGPSDSERISGSELMPFFIQTTYASTLVIGKTFEMEFVADSQARIERAISGGEIRNQLISLAEAGHTSNLSVADMDLMSTSEIVASLQDQKTSEAVRSLIDDFAAASEIHARHSGTILVLQQVARVAIKPKSEKSALAEVKRRMANIMGSSNVHERAMIDSIEMARDNAAFRGIEALYMLTMGKSFDDASGAGRFGTNKVNAWGTSSSAIELSSLAANSASDGVGASLTKYTDLQTKLLAVVRNELLDDVSKKEKIKQINQELALVDENFFKLAGVQVDDSGNLKYLASSEMVVKKEFTSNEQRSSAAYSTAYMDVVGLFEDYSLDNVMKAFDTASAQDTYTSLFGDDGNIFLKQGLDKGDAAIAEIHSQLKQAAELSSQLPQDAASRNRQQAMLLAAVRPHIFETAAEAMALRSRARGMYEERTAYMRAAHEGKRWNLISGSTSVESKINTLSTMIDRGKFTDASALERVISDVFNEFQADDMNLSQVKEMLTNYGSEAFSNNLIELYEDFRNSSTFDIAKKKMAQRTRNQVSLEQSLSQGIEPTEEGTKALQAVNEGKAKLMSMLGYSQETFAHSQNPAIDRNLGHKDAHQVGQAVDRIESKMTSGKGSLVGGFLTNILAPGLLMGASGMVGAASSESISETMGSLLAFAAVGVNPTATAQLMNNVSNDPRSDQQHRMLNAMMMGAGMLGGIAGGMGAERAAFRYLQSTKAGARGNLLTSMLANTVGGFVGGLVASAGVAAVAKSSQQASLPYSIADLPDLSEGFTGMEDVLESLGEGVSNEVIELYDAGELVAYGFYTRSSAAMEEIDEDISVAYFEGYITGHSYEKESQAVAPTHADGHQAEDAYSAMS